MPTEPDPRTATRPPGAWRASIRIVALGASGSLGLLAVGGAPGREAATLVWLGLWAMPAGYLAGRLVSVPGLLAALAVTVMATLPTLLGLPHPFIGWISVAGLYLWGAGLARRSSTGGWSGAGALLLIVGVASALPSAGGILAQPWPPAWTVILLDLSPIVWVVESAGLDWMRHPAVYERAGTGDLGPEMRVAWAGVGGPLLLLFLSGPLLDTGPGRWTRIRIKK